MDRLTALTKRPVIETSNVRLSSGLHQRGRSFVAGFAILAVVLATPMISGCSSETTNPQASTQPSAAEAAATAPTEPAPEVIVSQFLDRVRRGGDDSNASELLTKLAQQEMTRIGRPLQFPGSPDTTFEVGQSIPVPEEKNSVWVQTFLAEPVDAGQEFRYEVVWTLKKEVDGWRISGFAIDQGEGAAPLLLDFENGADMAERLAEAEQEDAPANR